MSTVYHHSALQVLALLTENAVRGSACPVTGLLCKLCHSQTYASENFHFFMRVLAGKCVLKHLWHYAGCLWIWTAFVVEPYSKGSSDTSRAELISPKFKCLPDNCIHFAQQVTVCLCWSAQTDLLCISSVSFFFTGNKGKVGNISVLYKNLLGMVLCDTKLVFWRSVCDRDLPVGSARRINPRKLQKGAFSHIYLFWYFCF